MMGGYRELDQGEFDRERLLTGRGLKYIPIDGFGIFPLWTGYSSRNSFINEVIIRCRNTVFDSKILPVS